MTRRFMDGLGAAVFVMESWRPELRRSASICKTPFQEDSRQGVGSKAAACVLASPVSIRCALGFASLSSSAVH